MHKVHTGRLLPRKFQMLTRYIKEAITKGGKCYLSALFFLWGEREREREEEDEDEDAEANYKLLYYIQFPKSKQHTSHLC